MNVEEQVRERYSQGAQEVVPALCCPVDYDRELLEILPREIIDRDYGCGDPSRYVRAGDTVLDLGSGGGKICYMAAQLVGADGRVIGVDMNDDMLALARKYQPEIAEKLGGDRVEFHKGRIQDLALSLDRLAAYLRDHPVTDLASADALSLWQRHQRHQAPMIADNSVDLVISNCVLNLVADEEKKQLVDEIYRVVKPGGRVAISDIVADAPIPEELKADPELWSGCISGSFEESEFLHAFQRAGFTAVTLDKWDEKPWRVEGSIEFRSVTLTALKDPIDQQTEGGHAVIYRGPMAAVTDDLGNHYVAGQRTAVPVALFNRLGEPPFADHFIRLAPATPLPAAPYTLPSGSIRAAAVTRGGLINDAPTVTEGRGDSCCGPQGCC